MLKKLTIKSKKQQQKLKKRQSLINEMLQSNPLLRKFKCRIDTFIYREWIEAIRLSRFTCALGQFKLRVRVYEMKTDIQAPTPE